MSRLVMCRKYKEELPGLIVPPMPGAKGQEIFETVSQKAWQEWQSHQTMLINEKHLNLLNPEHRKFVQDEMEKFLDNADFEEVEGFVPVKDTGDVQTVDASKPKDKND